jgi:hypothetical protein
LKLNYVKKYIQFTLDYFIKQKKTDIFCKIIYKTDKKKIAHIIDKSIETKNNYSKRIWKDNIRKSKNKNRNKNKQII